MSVSPKRRAEVFARDREADGGVRCHFGGRRMSDAEALIVRLVAKSQGGSPALENLVLACPHCSGSKGARAQPYTTCAS